MIFINICARLYDYGRKQKREETLENPTQP